jgi:hypothetical protein
MDLDIEGCTRSMQSLRGTLEPSEKLVENRGNEENL